jgi:hypothetical protein
MIYIQETLGQYMPSVHGHCVVALSGAEGYGFDSRLMYAYLRTKGA